MFKQKVNTILSEINKVLEQVDQREVDLLISFVTNANKIVVCGAGRVGYSIKGFGMRLAHMGLDVFALGDVTVPSIGVGDLLIVASGSGETQTIFDIVAIAKKNNSKIALITGNPESRMGHLADTIVKLSAPSKTKAVDGFVSIQPMTTLNEQSLGIFFDSVVLLLMNQLNESHDTMWARHSNLE